MVRDAGVGELATAAGAAAATIAELSLSDRAALLEEIASNLQAAETELVALAEQESSLGTARLTGELGRTTGQLQLFAAVLRDGGFLEATLDAADDDAVPPRPDLRRYLVPLGPVAVFTASNFPFAFSVAGGDTASALAAGCPVIVKAHSGHPKLSHRTAQIVSDSIGAHGLPEGTFGHVEGREAGIELVERPEIRAVGFTGSLGAGRSLFDLAVRRPDPIPFYGELSSINPVVIGPHAASTRAEQIAQGLLASITKGVGQFCTKPGVVFVPEGDDLTSEVSRLLEGGEFAGAKPMLNQRILDGFTEGLERLMGATSVEIVGGVQTLSGAPAATPMVFVTDLKSFRANAEVLYEECFGPTCILVRYSSLLQLEQSLLELPGALVGCLHAEPDERLSLAGVFARLRDLAGRVVLDGWPTGVAVSWSMNHGGPWPATTNAMHTSVGATAIRRFLRPVTFQNVPEELLPEALRDDNPLGIPRRANGSLRLP